MSNYAPVVVFGYNRADMLERLLDSLERNSGINRMKLYIFLDVPGTKNRKDISLSEKVITFAENYKSRSRFREVHIEIAETHRGLANSIIYGVTKTVNQHGKVIVLEDDLVVSNDFINYMQRGLEFYRHNNKVWSIAGYCTLFPELKHCKEDVLLLPRAESWGWGTWVDRWNKTDWDVATYHRFRCDPFQRIRFNLGGRELCQMLDKQMSNKNNDSWAIRWNYQQFLEGRYTVYPKETRVLHYGNDSRSTHCRGISCKGRALKETYKRCKFVNLEPNIMLILGNRRACKPY